MKDKKLIKLLAVGDGVIPTGFSRVMHSILLNLPKNVYDIHHLAINYYGDPHGFEHKIYPAMSMTQPSSYHGFEKIPTMLEYVKPDVMFILNDIWVINKYLKVIKKYIGKKPLPKIVVYFPVDGEGYMPEWFEDFDIVSEVLVYTEYGKEQVLSAFPSLKVTVIPHGVDTETFKPLADSRLEFKKEFYKGHPHVNPNDFIVFNGNRNQPRKNLDISLLGFGIFATKYPDVRYFHHAGIKDAGWDILGLIDSYSRELGIDLMSKVIMPSMQPMSQQVLDSTLNAYYNASDVGINTSSSEGFGLVSIEHAATGAPQIVSKNSVIPELWSDCGIMMEPSFTNRDYTNNLTRRYVSAETVAKALELAYTNVELYKDLAIKSYTKFTDKKYNWKNIAKKFDKVFRG